jgi:hypothetical protein
VTNIAQGTIVATKNVLSATGNVVVALFYLLTMLLPPEWVSVSAKHPDQYPLMACPDDNDSKFLLLLPTTFAYAAFGAVHCIAWNFAPYSRVVQVLWRTASLAVTVIPSLSLVLFGLAGALGSKSELVGLIIIFVVMPPGYVAYIVARIALLILPFLELTRLPNDAFKTVSWDDFFPHIA